MANKIFIYYIASIKMSTHTSLTSHIDVSGTTHISSRKDDEIQDVADDAEATNGRQHDTVTDPPQSRCSWILQHIQIFWQQANIVNLTCVARIHHLAALFSIPHNSFTPSRQVSSCHRGSHGFILELAHSAITCAYILRSFVQLT